MWFAAYDTQVKHQLGKLRRDLEAVEKFPPKHHPTSASALLEGCVNRCLLSPKVALSIISLVFRAVVWRPLRIHCAALKSSI